MMNQRQAIQYGQQVGVKFYIKNSNGCILGGTRTREEAEAMKEEFEVRAKYDPFARGMNLRFYIEEA